MIFTLASSAAFSSIRRFGFLKKQRRKTMQTLNEVDAAFQKQTGGYDNRIPAQIKRGLKLEFTRD